MVWWEEGGRSSMAVASLSDGNEVYCREMPRGLIGYGAWIGTSLSTKATALALVIPEGEQADSIMAYSRELDARCESIRDTVHLSKQYCSITMRFSEGSLMGGEDATVKVKGHWNGWTLGDWSPVKGAFSCAAERISPLEWRVTVPRQGDDSLVIEVCSEVASGTLPLGEYLSAAAYDWSAVNLADVRIDVDWSAWRISITIEEWRDGRFREYII